MVPGPYHSVQVPWGVGGRIIFLHRCFPPWAQGTFLEPRSLAARFLPPASSHLPSRGPHFEV